MKWFTTKVKLPAFTPLRVLVLLITWLVALWVGLLVVSILLIAYLPKTIALVWLLIVTLLIGLLVLALLEKELWALWLGYTKTTKAHGRGTLTTFGGAELSDYETFQKERMILSLLALRLFEENMVDDKRTIR